MSKRSGPSARSAEASEHFKSHNGKSPCRQTFLKQPNLYTGQKLKPLGPANVPWRVKKRPQRHYTETVKVGAGEGHLDQHKRLTISNGWRSAQKENGPSAGALRPPNWALPLFTCSLCHSRFWTLLLAAHALEFLRGLFLLGWLFHRHELSVLFIALGPVAPPSVVLSCVRFLTAPLRALSPTGLLTAMTYLPLMRTGFVPLLEVDFGISVVLLFLRIALPGLIRLLMGALISPLPGIGFRRFFAHRFYLLRNKSSAAKRVPSRNESP